VIEIDRRTVVGMMEEPVSIDAADPSAWVRRYGRRLCALHTESITGDPFGRDRAAAASRS